MLKNYFSIFCLIISSYAFSQANTSTDPNIIFFIVDDLGYFDINVYKQLQANGPDLYETPNMDALASAGIMFTHGYEAAPRCAASRTSIMSGKFESRPSVSSGMYAPSDNNPEYSEETWAKLLQDRGYETYFVGKWHIGNNANHDPSTFGFTTSEAGGAYGAPPTYWYPYGTLGTDHPEVLVGGTTGDYLTDKLTDLTNSFIDDHVTNNPSVPFLAMVSHYGVHTPFEAEAADVAYFQNKVNNNTYTGNEYENDITAKTKLRQDHATYAAMIKSVDESLGQIRQNLIDEGIEDNTVIILTSDNGGLSTTEINGTRELATSNRPFRGGKTWLLEGGIRLPIIVYGPDFRQGVTVDTPITGTDFFPTILEIGGAPLAPMQHLDGESFLPLLETAANGGNASYTRTNPLIWDFNFASSGTANVSMAAARQGNYKLIEYKYNNVFELYDVVNDPGETTDISAANPAIVEQLKTALFSYRSNAGIGHRVTNTTQMAENTYLYENMNTVTGSNIQPSYGCAEPNGTTNEIIYNAGFECWYDLDWPIRVDTANGSDASLAIANPIDTRTGDTSLQVNVVNGGGYGRVRITNTQYFDEFQGGDIVLNVYAKSLATNRIRFQLRVNYSDGSNASYNATEFTTDGTYRLYSHTFPTATATSASTESIEVRLQLGRDNGTIFLDDWSSAVNGITLSTPIFDESKISVYPNPAKDFINISGPLVVTKAYIFDITGKLVKKSIGDVERINISELPTGIYMLKAFVEGKQYFTKKIVIE